MTLHELEDRMDWTENQLPPVRCRLWRIVGYVGVVVVLVLAVWSQFRLGGGP